MRVHAVIRWCVVYDIPTYFSFYFCILIPAAVIINSHGLFVSGQHWCLRLVPVALHCERKYLPVNVSRKLVGRLVG